MYLYTELLIRINCETLRQSVHVIFILVNLSTMEET